MAGMGGQGVMRMGQLLAHAALIEGMNVVWFPAYGPETRGGTANCTVILSTEEIGSPVTSSPDTLLALNQVMLDQFVDSVKREGLIVVNSSLATPPSSRPDCKIVEVPANQVAAELGNDIVVNMVMLGAYVQLARPVKLESVKASLEEVLPPRLHGFIPLNIQALNKGGELFAMA